VAAELFPVMVDSNANPSYIGITVGFALGLGLIYGLEFLVDHIEQNNGKICGKKEVDSSVHSNPPIKTYPRGYGGVPGEGGDIQLNELMKNVENGAWQDEAVERSSKLMNSPAHKNHIVEHLNELSELLKSIEEKTQELQKPEISMRQCEHIAEHMDERVHMLQYKLDHTRR